MQADPGAGIRVRVGLCIEGIQHLRQPVIFAPPSLTQVAESVDALVSNTSEAIRAGSSPALGTS